MCRPSSPRPALICGHIEEDGADGPGDQRLRNCDRKVVNRSNQAANKKKEKRRASKGKNEMWKRTRGTAPAETSACLGLARASPAGLCHADCSRHPPGMASPSTLLAVLSLLLVACGEWLRDSLRAHMKNKKEPLARLAWAVQCGLCVACGGLCVCLGGGLRVALAE